MLFVSHDASRTGAPILFLHLLRWIKSNSDLEFEILLRDGGQLEGDFAALAPMTVFRTRGGTIARTVARGVGLDGFAAHARTNRLIRGIKRAGFGLVYSNTITNGQVVARVAPRDCPVVTHVHELDSEVRRAGEENLRLVMAQTRQYIAGSQVVRSNLVDRHGVDSALVRVIHDFSATDGFDGGPPQRAGADFRTTLGIPEDARVVGAVGSICWRKAPDLFVQLAYRTHLKRPPYPVHFVWIGGGGPADDRIFELMQDTRNVGLSSFVHFVPARPNLFECYCSFDVFALVSREDPFPLVCLEAAAVRKPILCFAGAGGEPEFVEQDCGFVVPYLDIEAMAQKLLTLFDSEPLRQQMGECAARKAKERHDVSIAGPLVLDVIDQQLGNPGTIA